MTLNSIMCFDIWAKFIVLVPSGVTSHKFRIAHFSDEDSGKCTIHDKHKLKLIFNTHILY